MKRLFFALLALSVGLAGCPEDDDEPQSRDGGTDISQDVQKDVPDDMGTDTADTTPDMDTGPTGYKLTIENISDQTSFPTAFSPGTLALHTGGQPLYAVGISDRLDGLEDLAEDGESFGVTNALGTLSDVVRTESFEGPRGPIRPGQSATVVLEDLSADQTPRLTMATMFVESNDYLLGTPDSGYALFDGGSFNGGEITDELVYTDIGSERDQYPYYGPTQAPRSADGIGAEEGRIREFEDSTRALPQAYALADVEITESGGDFTIKISNVGKTTGGIVTPLSPPAYAVHNGNASLFTRGEAAGNGLERLAEDGKTQGLVNALSAAGGVKNADAASSGIAPGDSVEFTVTPDSSHKRLSFATMVVRTNDAFLSFPAEGLKLLDDQGNPRPTGELEAEAARTLGVWDAGTELNGPIGNNTNQPYFTDEVDVGVPDSEVDGVQPYGGDSASENDLAALPSYLDISVSRQGETANYDITITNETDKSPNRYVISPMIYLAHSANNPVFRERNEAGSALTQLAELGKTQPLVDSRSEMSATSDPLQPGQSVTISVTGTESRPQLTFMAMVIPSNDAFIAANPAGVSLLAVDQPLEADRVERAIENSLTVWDAGTEQNQPGGAGAGQPNPLIENSGQDPMAGFDEGDGTVQRATTPLLPPIEDIVRVTLEKRE